MHEQIWKGCLAYIQQQVPEQSFQTWFRPIRAVHFEGNTLTLQVPTVLFYEWLEENYVHVLHQAVRLTVGGKVGLEYSVRVTKDPERPEVPRLAAAPSPHRSPQSSQALEMYRELDTGHHISPRYDFDNFVEGSCNRLAKAASMKVVSDPSSPNLNPLVVYGGVGLGKTHLLHAIGNEIHKNNLDKKVNYIAAERFTNQFIEATLKNVVQEFLGYYRNVDVLMVDDVQFFYGKNKTQETFFHIFNHLHQQGKQIILTFDKRPGSINGIHERLTSRFKWALTTELSFPDYDTRMEIVRQKMESEKVSTPESVVEYIALSVETNVRDIEGVVASLMAHATLNNVKVTIELAKNVIRSVVSDIRAESHVDYIQKSVAAHFQISLKELLGSSRKRDVVMPRQVAMYVTKLLTRQSFKHIGEQFGGKDHGTVMYSIKVIENSFETDKKFRQKVEQLIRGLKQKKIGAPRSS